MVEVLSGIFFLACIGFGYGLVRFFLAKRDGDAVLKKKSINLILNSIAYGLASLVGLWLDSVGLLLNGWVLAGCLIGGFLLQVSCRLYVEKCQALNRLVLGALRPFDFVGVVLVFLGLEIILVYAYPDGLGVVDIIMWSIVGLMWWLIAYSERLDKQERRERDAKRQRTEQLEETLREALVTVGKVPDDVDWNELEPVLRELTIRKMEALSEDKKREAYEMFHVRYSDQG